MIVPKCPICGAQHVNCGPASTVTPVDLIPKEVIPMATHEDMVIVKTGQTESAGIKMRRSEAERYVKEHEGASIVGGYETKDAQPKRTSKEDKS